VATVAGVFILYGWEFLMSGFRRRSLITGLPAAWSYGAIFASGCLILFFCIRNVLFGEQTADSTAATSL
jgi:TRAP-type C4-dicarboxylate transport system permease small subunit